MGVKLGHQAKTKTGGTALNIFAARQFESYLLGAIHPKVVQEQLRSLKQTPLLEWICWSWVFVILGAIVQIVFLRFIVAELSFLNQGLIAQFREFFWGTGQFPAQASFLFLLGIEALVFPLWSILTAKYWVFIFDLGQDLLTPQRSSHKISEDIVALSFSSYLFSFIPIVGGPAQGLARFYILFQSLRNRLEIGAVPAIAFLILPYIILTLSFVILGGALITLVLFASLL